MAAPTRNWHIVQDRRGVMYFANHGGLLEYDGVSWRRIYTGKSRRIRMVKTDTTGRIWVAAFKELGYLA
ncbi:hypothetical protein IH970_14285 [candidate division KSB1 bacterium]|nr:hypothetical protein [candidate division KSB1 bacterium]